MTDQDRGQVDAERESDPAKWPPLRESVAQTTRDLAIARAADAFAALCDAQRGLIDAEAELVLARAARVRAEPPPPTREQIAGSAPADAGRAKGAPFRALSREQAVAQWGADPGAWPQWVCSTPTCSQLNSGSAMECGRCGQSRPTPAPESIADYRART